MTTNRERAVAALKGHGQPPMSITLLVNVIDRLCDAGLLKEDLPAPDNQLAGEAEWQIGTRAVHGAVFIDEFAPLDPETARALAFALLAAADYAEKGE